MILNELFKQHSILLLLFAILVWTIFKFPKIVKRQKAIQIIVECTSQKNIIIIVGKLENRY